MQSTKRLAGQLLRSKPHSPHNLTRGTRLSHFLTSDTVPSYRTRLSPLSPIKEILYSDVHSLLELKMVSVNPDAVKYVRDFIGPKFDLPENVIRELVCISHMMDTSAQRRAREFEPQTEQVEDTLGYSSIYTRVALGEKAFRFAVFTYLSGVPSWSRKKANLMNFDMCRSGLAERLTKDETLLIAFVKDTKLPEVLYRPVFDEEVEQRNLRKPRKVLPKTPHNVHFAMKMLYAMIGAVQVEHGGNKAEQFVHDVILEGYMTRGIMKLV